MSEDRPRRPRPSGGAGRPSGSRPGGKSTGGKSTGGKSTGGRSSSDRSSGRAPRAGDGDRSKRPYRPDRDGAGRDGRSARTTDRPTRPERRNEAERRAAEVRARRAPRTPQDPEVERQRIEARETEQWIDEGSIRAEAAAATARAGRDGGPRKPPEIDPEVVAEIHAGSADPRRAARLTERLAAASGALDRERFDDARRMVASVVRELPMLAAGHEINGLALYRTGKWRQAAQSLELARQIHVDPALLPVLADCYRALKRWSDVEAVWRELRELSPTHEVMAEGRIIAAGALADQGDLKGAIALVNQAQKPLKKVREHHLRQWYVLADLLDRAGDTVGATRWFREIAAHDSDFVDVRERLRALGR